MFLVLGVLDTPGPAPLCGLRREELAFVGLSVAAEERQRDGLVVHGREANLVHRPWPEAGERVVVGEVPDALAAVADQHQLCVVRVLHVSVSHLPAQGLQQDLVTEIQVLGVYVHIPRHDNLSSITFKGYILRLHIIQLVRHHRESISDLFTIHLSDQISLVRVGYLPQ